MSEEYRSILVGTIGLTAAAFGALLLTLSRGGVVAGAQSIKSTVRIAAIAIVLQLGHFVEEAVTGFPHRFPQILGLAQWPMRFFVWFNLIWCAIWILACWGLYARRQVALFPLWFLGLASVVNGVAHPVLALRAGGYFPGLFTSPLIGIAGVLVLTMLASVTRKTRGSGVNGMKETSS